MARYFAGRVLRRKPFCHRPDGILLPGQHQERSGQAPSAGMCASLARPLVRRRTQIRARARHWQLRSALSFEWPCAENSHGNRAGLARLWSICHTVAPSVMAQQQLAQEQSVVSLRTCSVAARSRRANPLTQILIVVLLSFTTACVPRIAAQGPEIRMPTIEQSQATGPGIEGDHYVTRDGLRLGLMHWDAQNPFAILVALHGMSDYSNAFAMPAPWWAEHGISTYAYDQRGFGRSPNPGIWPDDDVLRRDLSDFVDVIKARFPGL